MTAAGFAGMRIRIWHDSAPIPFVRMDCMTCGAWICQYTETDLDELRSEYAYHITINCWPDAYCHCGRRLFNGACHWRHLHAREGLA